MSGRFDVTLTERASADLAAIRDYLIARSQTRAENVRLAIKATIEQLRSFPRLGRDRPRLRVRVIGVPRYPYTIYYRVSGTSVEIVHVRDDRRRPPKPGDF